MKWDSNLCVKFYSRFMVRYPICPRILFKFSPEDGWNLYRKYLDQSNHHLEVGTASVESMLQANVDEQRKQSMHVTLLDYDDVPLRIAQQDLVRDGYKEENIQTVCCDLMKMQQRTLSPNMYDTIGISAVLHCVPTPLTHKFVHFLDSVASNMHHETQLFGTTFLQPSANDRSFQAKFIQKMQEKGTMCNQSDTLEDLHAILDERFTDYNIHTIGYCTFFEATHCKQIKLTKSS